MRDDSALPVLMVVASEDDGGMARSVFLLARDLRAEGIAPAVAVHRESPLARRLRELSLPVHVVPALIESGMRGPGARDRGAKSLVHNLRAAPHAASALNALARQHGARVLYSHGTWSNYIAALAARQRTTPPVVWHIRNDHSKPAARWAGRALAGWGDVAAILAVSNSAAAPYRGLRNRLEVILNGVDYEAIARVSAPANLRAQLGLDAGTLLVGFAGRLEPHKGVGVLLEAMRGAVARAPQLHLVVLGGSARHAGHDQAAALGEQAARWGIADHVHLLGYIDGVEPQLAALDLVSVPSICKDGCPRTAIESLALGVPLVGSNIGGIPEVVRDGETGILVPAGDAGALADALVALSRDIIRRERMSLAAAADARARFDSRRTAAAVARVLHDVAAPAPAANAARVPA